MIKYLYDVPFLLFLNVKLNIVIMIRVLGSTKRRIISALTKKVSSAELSAYENNTFNSTLTKKFVLNSAFTKDSCSKQYS